MNYPHPLSDRLYQFYLEGTVGVPDGIIPDEKKFYDFIQESFDKLCSFTDTLSISETCTWCILKGAFLILCECHTTNEHLYNKLCEIEMEERRAIDTGVLS